MKYITKLEVYHSNDIKYDVQWMFFPNEHEQEHWIKLKKNEQQVLNNDKYTPVHISYRIYNYSILDLLNMDLGDFAGIKLIDLIKLLKTQNHL